MGARSGDASSSPESPDPGEPLGDGLVSLTQHCFGPSGHLAQAAAHYRPRAGQQAMAQAVAQTLQDGAALVVEAGTGVGKTFAYLVPLLLSGQRALVSTGTKALQDQLFDRDLPAVVAALKLPVRVALLKGRNNYLCLHRLQAAPGVLAATDDATWRDLAVVQRWATATASGDLEEVADAARNPNLRPWVSSTADNCLGGKCPVFADCHLQKARREALAADVVVINHHLFFADQAVRESGMAELLPSVQAVVFDEAHQLNEVGVAFLGLQWGSAAVTDLARDLLAAGHTHARGLAPWNDLCNALDSAARQLRLAWPHDATGRMGWSQPEPDGVRPGAFAAALADVQAAAQLAAGAAQLLAETEPDLARMAERAEAMARTAGLLAQPTPADHVRWAEVGHHLRLHQAPLDIAQHLGPMVSASAGHKAWVFTSATLGMGEDMRWFTEPCGLVGATTLKVPSPFDYARQALMVLPSWPKPTEGGHEERVADLVAQAAAVLGGRTLVLTSTTRAMQDISQRLKDHPLMRGLQLLTQGQGSRAALLKEFRQAGEGAATGAASDDLRGAVLVATASFREGIDIPGRALQLVVIDRIGFPPPNDPIVAARSQRIEAAGGRAFASYFLPEAAVVLKQGSGRLIRSESDRGVLVLCDSRLTTMPYGRQLLAALPPMARTQDLGTLDRALQRLLEIEKAPKGLE